MNKYFYYFICFFLFLFSLPFSKKAMPQQSNNIFQEFLIEESADSLYFFWRFDTRTPNYFQIEISNDGKNFRMVGEKIAFKKDTTDYKSSIKKEKNLLFSTNFILAFLLIIFFFNKIIRRSSKRILLIFMLMGILSSCVKEGIDNRKEEEKYKKIFIRIAAIVESQGGILSETSTIKVLNIKI